MRIDIAKTWFMRALHPISTIKYIQYLHSKNIAYNIAVVDAEYAWLLDKAVPNTAILDIGAFDGDTALLFSLFPNISEVISFEPDARIFNEAKRNLKGSKNIHKNKIKLHNLAIGKDLIKERPRMGLSPKDHTSKTISLNKAIAMTKKKIIIKSDCESGEYSIFTRAVNLSRVYAMQIEYHEGPKDLPKILREKGFKVTVGPEHKIRDENTFYQIGYIYAERSKYIKN